MPKVLFLADYQVPDYPGVVYGHGHMLQIDTELADSLQALGKVSLLDNATTPLVSVTVTPSNTDCMIDWATVMPTHGQVNWGSDIDYGAVATDGDIIATQHSVTLNGLHPNSVYHYQLIALAEGVCITSDDRSFIAQPGGTEMWSA